MKRSAVVASASILLALVASCGPVESPGLEGTAWVLDLPEEQANAGLIPVEVTLTFTSDDSIEGAYGPQKYAGSYRVDGDTISFDELCWTTMSCMAAGGTLNLEQEYLFALEDAASFSMESDSLTLHMAGGRTLTYTRG
ncbi:MAG: META domain-containing protein [Dehalococcoidia bacterium]|nr:META domain-containing protein [Dehalococcoidia bacterium]